MIVGLHHVAIGVNDFEKALDFYTNALGFELLQRTEFDNDVLANRAIGLEDVKAEMAMLRLANAFIELWQYRNPQPKDQRARPCDYGYPHIALQVKDIAAEYERLKEYGMEFVGDVVEFADVASAIYGRDPCGNIIELYEIKTDDMARLEDLAPSS